MDFSTPMVGWVGLLYRLSCPFFGGAVVVVFLLPFVHITRLLAVQHLNHTANPGSPRSRMRSPTHLEDTATKWRRLVESVEHFDVGTVTQIWGRCLSTRSPLTQPMAPSWFHGPLLPPGIMQTAPTIWANNQQFETSFCSASIGMIPLINWDLLRMHAGRCLTLAETQRFLCFMRHGHLMVFSEDLMVLVGVLSWISSCTRAPRVSLLSLRRFCQTNRSGLLESVVPNVPRSSATNYDAKAALKNEHFEVTKLVDSP